MLTAVPGHRCRAVLLIHLLALLCTVSSTAGGTDCSSSSSSCTAISWSPLQSASGTTLLAGPPKTAAAAAAAAEGDQSSRLGAYGFQWDDEQHHFHSRHLLQSAAITTACSSSSTNSAAADRAAILQIARSLVGDSRLQVAHARFTGSCKAVGFTALTAPHAFAALFPAAVVLSTGDVQQAAGDSQDSGYLLSTDLLQPGDSTIGVYTRDAAVLEIDLSTSSAVADGEQLVLTYLFGSEEYSTKNPNPDILSISIKDYSTGAVSDLAILPGGTRIPPPAVANGGNKPGVHVYNNAGGKYRTALNGFTQVCARSGGKQVARRTGTNIK